MKKLLLAVFAIYSFTAFSQTTTTGTPITNKNSWLKLGIDVGIPVEEASNTSSFVIGLDLKAQLMETKNLGIGIASGYNHFFEKENFNSFGAIPLGGFIRYYPDARGFFAGLDVGYSFLTSVSNTNGGFYIKPEIGYHNYNWNAFAFYNNIFIDGGNVSHVGIGATYNIRFR